MGVYKRKNTRVYCRVIFIALEYGVVIVYIEGSKVSNLCTARVREYVRNERDAYICE